MRLHSAVLLALCATAAQAQWPDVRTVGRGGESTVASDGKGSVYLTAHLPCTLYVSRDWGDTFAAVKSFEDGLGDMFVMTHGDSLVNVTYMPKTTDQVRSWYSNDGARTLLEGSAPHGPLDREWMVSNPDGKIYLDYSYGYIGGPKSKGVFLASSADNGKSFDILGQVDREPEGSYAIDPFLTQSSGGRMYAMWLVSQDYNTISAYDFAYSDSGVNFKGQQRVATFSPTLKGHPVDIQERWMIGAVLGVGEKTVVVVYPGYEWVDVDGEDELAFIEHYKVSTDGGVTFSEGKSVLKDKELQDAVRMNLKNRKVDGSYPYYIQILPWMCADKDGHIHMAFTDNRFGQTFVGDKPVNRWTVRMTDCLDVADGFGKSEQVSEEYHSRRTSMDFLSCTSDSKFIYVSWTSNDNSIADWGGAAGDLFTGNLHVARKPLK